MRTAYFWCRNTLFRFAVNHKPLLQIFGEIGELVQPRYKRGIEKCRDSNFSFCIEEHVFGGSSPPFPTIYLNIVGGAVEACYR